MPTIHDFLAHGFFPRELPPCFTTVSFADAVGAQTGILAGDPRTAKLCVHNLARAGTLRRRLGIVNPVHYYRLVEQIVANWTAIANHINTSSFSFSKPTSAELFRAVVPAKMFDDMEQARLVVRARAPLIVRTDINQFYGSIYTHSIPWALHTKAIAKQQRQNPALFGNALDRCVQNAQDGQTIGVPIGPDTSLVIAEVILASVDQELAHYVVATGACRQVDDYEVRANDRVDAERVLGNLQHALNQYELVLNPKKTKILDLPCPFADKWRHDVRRYRFRKHPTSQHYDLLAYYDLAFRVASESPDSAVVKYAVSRMRRIRIHPDNWLMHERFLHQAMLAEPGVTPEAISQLIRFQSFGMQLDLPGLAEVVDQQIRFHAPQGHGTEVAWGIWTALALDLPLTEAATDAAEAMDDSVVALLLLDAETQGQLPRAIDPARWAEFMTTDELYGEQWLLSYESRLKGWRASSGVNDHIQADPHFDWMRSNGVGFYEPVSRPAPPPVPQVDLLMSQDDLGFSPA